jgi:two-component system NtrC family sensor kinase
MKQAMKTLKSFFFFFFLIANLCIAQVKTIVQKVDSLCNIASEAYGNKEIEKAENAAKEALKMTNKSAFSKGKLKASFYETIINQNKNTSNYDIQIITKFKDQLHQQGLKMEEARALVFLSKVYSYYGDVTETVKNLLVALKIFEEINDKSGISGTRSDLSLMYYDQKNYEAAFENIRLAIAILSDSNKNQTPRNYNNLAIIFEKTGPIDSAIYYHKISLEKAKLANMKGNIGLSLSNLGNNYVMNKQYALAEKTLLEALAIRESIGNKKDLAYTHNRLANLYLKLNNIKKAKFHATQSLENAEKASELKIKRMAYERLMEVAQKESNPKVELLYLKKVTDLKDSILSESNTKEITKRMMTYNFEKKQMLDSLKNAKEVFETELVFSKKLETERSKKIIFMISGAFFLLLAFTIYRRYLFKTRELEHSKNIESAFGELQKSHQILRETQAQLIQSEKLASLGELTAGIAHEIQNPLNFVNNFSEMSVELAKELKEEAEKPEMDIPLIIDLANDLSQNQEKINLHGKRASSIVSGMLEHSRNSTGKRVITDINKLADEYLRLSYHGIRAKDGSFKADYELIADKNLSQVEVIPQDMGRVLLNLINNGFWAVNERSKKGESGYEPKVTVSTQLNANSQLLIAIKDNGTGMTEDIKAKIFQPFFTTKPTGQGTGLGLSLAYDIVTKGHGGTLEAESVQGEGTTFMIKLPIS